MDYASLAAHIMPAEAAPGHYYLGSGTDKPHTNVALASTVAEIGETMQRNVDSYTTQNNRTRTVHWAVGKYGNSRKRADTLATRAIVLDIDVDDPMSIPDAYDMMQSLAADLEKDGLPGPTLAFSTGIGVHVYWVPARTYVGDEIEDIWQPAARGLRHWLETNKYELCKDIAKTVNRTAFIRMPLTLNQKVGVLGQAVHNDGNIAGDMTHITDDMIERLVRIAPVQNKAAPSNNVASQAGVTSLAGSTAIGTETKVINDPQALLTQCRALRHIMSSGTQTYEEWFAAARLFIHSNDIHAGREAYHEFSNASSEYDAMESDGKFDSALEAGAAAPTCLDFRRSCGLNKTSCDGCPMKRSATSNGRPHALQAEHYASAAQASPVVTTPAKPAKPAEIALSPSASQLIDAENHQLDVIRSVAGTHAYMDLDKIGITFPAHLFSADQEAVNEVFICETTNAMCVNHPRKDGKQTVVDRKVLCQRPIFPIKLVQELQPEGNLTYGLKIAEVKLPQQGATTGGQTPQIIGRTVVVPSKDLHASSGTLRSSLASAKIPITAIDSRDITWKRLHEWLHRVYNALDPADADIRESGFGWRREDFADQRHFIIGDRAYRAGDRTNLVEQDGSGKSFTKKISVGTDTEEAFNIVRALSKEATPEMLFLMCAALGTPLMQMTSSKGVMINLPGKTGIGKTALLSFLNSYYVSADQDGIAASGGDTMLASMNIVGVYRNLPVMIDEITLRTEEEIGHFLMQLTQGHERNRMESASNKLRETASWATIVFSSSNKPIGEMISAHSETAEAQRARVMEVVLEEFVDGKDTRYFVERYLKPMHGHAGLIGTVFMRFVLNHYDQVKDIVRQSEESLKNSDSPLNAFHGDKFRLWRAAASTAISAAAIGNLLGLWDIQSAKMSEIVGSLAASARDRHTSDKLDAGEFVKTYINHAEQHLVIPQILDLNGNVKAASPGNEQAPLVAGARAAHIELLLQEGKRYAQVIMAHVPLKAYCKEQNINVDYAVDSMRDADILVEPGVSNKQIGVSAGVSGRISGGPTAKRMIPATEAVVVHLPLAEPFDPDHPPKYV